jgi:predicted SprT family Zn-dependent metalloprotease
MRMILPPLRERRAIDRLLQSFFDSYRAADFRRAIIAISRFYALPTPKVVWFEYLDWGKSGGRTYENGKIHLVHPENWKRGRKYNSARQWIQTVYHELGHYVFWSDAERKADKFAYRMFRGVNGTNGTRAIPRIGAKKAPSALSRTKRRRAA